MANDMVVDQNLNPAYINTPDKTKQWLVYRIKTGFSLSGYQVRIGRTMQFVSLAKYLRGISLVEKETSDDGSVGELQVDEILEP